MRIWVVDPKVLDNQRVLGAHNEIHMAVGLIKDSIKRGRVHGLLEGWYHNKGFAAIVHYHELIVKEMESRGWTGHQTPLIIPDEIRDDVILGRVVVSYVDDYWPPTFVASELIAKDVNDLKERWEREKYTPISLFVEKYGAVA